MVEQREFYYSESARYSEFYVNIYTSLLKHIGLSYYNTWSHLPVYSDAGGRKMLTERCIELMSNFHSDGYAALFREGIALSEMARGFSQIKVRLVDDNRAVERHNDWITDVEGYEFGFFVMILRYVQNIRWAKECLRDGDRRVAHECISRSAEIYHIISKTSGLSDIVDLYSKLGGDSVLLHSYRMDFVDLAEELGVIDLSSVTLYD